MEPFILKVTALRNRARIVKVDVIKGPGNVETQIWGLENHKSLMIQAHRRQAFGRSEPVFDSVELVDIPFHKAVSKTRRQYKRAREKSGANLELEMSR